MSGRRRMRAFAAATAVAVVPWFAVTATSAGAATTYSSVVLQDAPTAYWRLGDTTGSAATAATGHGNSGTYSGGVALGTPGAIAGDTNTAATFNGSTGQVSVP